VELLLYPTRIKKMGIIAWWLGIALFIFLLYQMNFTFESIANNELMYFVVAAVCVLSISSWLIIGGQLLGFILMILLYSAEVVALGYYVGMNQDTLSVMGFCLAFFSMSLMLTQIAAARNLSYIRPIRKWYEGQPRSIPNLLGTIHFTDGDKGCPCWVNRIDEEGAFVMVKEGSELSAVTSSTSKKLILEMKRGSLRSKCAVQAVSWIGEIRGLGCQYVFDGLDQRKELGDLIEDLKGAGYV